MTGDGPITRRRALAAGGSVAALALAGCTEEGQDSQDGTDGESGEQGGLVPPSAPTVPDDEYWAYVVESLDYQNAVLEQLLEDEG